MNRKPAYLTIQGQPLCVCEGHIAGLMYELRIACGHRSLADAKRAKAELQKHRHSVRVVAGHCPESFPTD